MNIRVQIKQWGNSKALRLPKEFINSMHLNTGDILELAQIDNETIKLVVIPQKKQAKRLTLQERIVMTSQQLPVCDEWDLIQPAGDEI